MKNITIAGISIEELKRQREIIQKDANKFIAEHLDTAEKIITKLTNSEEDDEIDIEALAKEAVELYKAVEIVAGVSGVTYYLPYSEEWGYDVEPFSSVLESRFDDKVYASRKESYLSELHSTLESMEYDSRMWNSSTC